MFNLKGTIKVHNKKLQQVAAEIKIVNNVCGINRLNTFMNETA